MGHEYVRGWNDAERHHGIGAFANSETWAPLEPGIYDARVAEAYHVVSATGRKLYRIEYEVQENRAGRTRRLRGHVVPDTYVHRTGDPNTSLISLLFEAGYTNDFPKDPGVFIGREVRVLVSQTTWNGRTLNRIDTVYPQIRNH